MTTRNFATKIGDTLYPQASTVDTITIVASTDDWHRSHDTPGTISSTILLDYGPHDQPPPGQPHPSTWPGQPIRILTLDPAPILPGGVITAGIVDTVTATRMQSPTTGKTRWAYLANACDAVGALQRLPLTITRPRETWQERYDYIWRMTYPPYDAFLPDPGTLSIDPLPTHVPGQLTDLAEIEYKDISTLEALQRTFLGWGRFIRRQPGGIVAPITDAYSISSRDGLWAYGSAPWARLRPDQVEDPDSWTTSVTARLDHVSITWRSWAIVPGQPTPEVTMHVRRPTDGPVTELHLAGDWRDNTQSAVDVLGSIDARTLLERITRYISTPTRTWASSEAEIILGRGDIDWELMGCPTSKIIDPRWADPRTLYITRSTTTITRDRQTISATLIPSEAAGVRPITIAETGDPTLTPRPRQVTFAQAAAAPSPINIWKTKYTESML